MKNLNMTPPVKRPRKIDLLKAKVIIPGHIYSFPKDAKPKGILKIHKNNTINSNESISL